MVRKMLSEKHTKQYAKRTNKKKRVKEKLDYKEKWNDYIMKKDNNSTSYGN